MIGKDRAVLQRRTLTTALVAAAVIGMLPLAASRLGANTQFTPNQTDRDNHLKSADFFDVEKFNEIKFESTQCSKLDDENYSLKGNLTIKGVTKEVVLNVDFGGIMKDPWGNEKAGFSVSGKINRSEWGLNWNAALEAGGMLVSDEVRINAEVQFVKQK